MKLIKGSKTPPLFQRLQLVLAPLNTLEFYAKKYGDIFTMITPAPAEKAVILSSPQALQEVLTKDNNEYEVPANKLLQSVFGEYSISCLEGDRHRRERKLLMPPFHGNRMRNYGDLICNITKEVASNLTVSKTFIARKLMQEITMQVILQTVFGLYDSPRLSQIRSMLTDFLELTASPLRASLLFFPWLQKDLGPWSPWGKYQRQQQKLNELLYTEIATRRSQLDPNRTDILTLMLLAQDEEGQGMTDQEIRDELMTLLLAGHETTATALAWAVYWVHKQPQVYQKLIEELTTLEIDAEPMTIFRLPYLTAVCQETLRIYPVVVMTFPRRTKQPVELQGYHLEADTTIRGSIYLTHQREDLYPEPKKFKPERFLEKKFSPYEYLPFGGGSRRCLGMALADFEMRLVLATLLSNFEMELAENQPVKPQRRGVTLGPKGGVKMLMKAKRILSQTKPTSVATV
ncbi:MULTISPECIES: cytochrome P450 [unclassified Okeania]|uniref:cytochrome P450 n=1 Tax=unclassified Okeania TaxID=2634635 RepID=UPI0013BA773F|nr:MULTISPECIES: cytochrome P450 [unclassified Okeania]NES77738.1 cytochrome P450 [Okeania sp. SIO1H4]NET12147.1 cytochrome P450 [Okeania sp. SIO1H6]NET21337.1 cytochrome P450 [Okeania sp. SIO1H5]NET94556.1 cytochrome P450 [Okeania sp. SIO1H2]